MDTNIYEESAQRAWDAILGKVKELEASGMKRAEISRLLGHTGRSAVTNWLKESSTSRNASFPDMLRYIDVLGLDIQDYLPKAATIRRPAPNAPVEKADADGSVAIHVYALAGAGPAFDLEENDPLATIRVPLEYAMQCDSALLVKGDSMAWTIKSGGVVGVIRRNFDFVAGEVYAVRLPYEGLSIKRVIVDAASGEYIIRSDNPDKEKYPDRRLSITEYADIILGRVVWVWQAV